MSEDEAKAWLVAHFGEQFEQLKTFVDLVIAENQRQNLVSASTIDGIWSRHVVDSAQLAAFATPNDRAWLDIGTGGGFPGLVVALLRPEPFILVEPRRRRAGFLVDAVAHLGLAARVSVIAAKVEAVTKLAGTISARAVASVHDLLLAAEQCADSGTEWVFPRGKIDSEEVASLRHSWQFAFHVEQSVTNPGSSILILRDVKRR